MGRVGDRGIFSVLVLANIFALFSVAKSKFSPDFIPSGDLISDRNFYPSFFDFV